MQDWNPIVIKKNTSTTQKTHITYTHSKPVDDDNLKIKYVTREQSQLVTNGRLAKKLTRKQLALSMQIQESVIADWENGKAIYSGPMYDRFKRTLGVKEDSKV